MATQNPIIKRFTAELDETVQTTCVCGLIAKTKQEEYFCPKCGTALIIPQGKNKKVMVYGRPKGN